MKFIYNDKGNAVGFRQSNFIYEIKGRAIGQIINNKHVHKINGQYIGELYEDMVVDMNMGNLGNVGNCGNPGNTGSPGNPGNRGSINYGYKDVFKELL